MIYLIKILTEKYMPVKREGGSLRVKAAGDFGYEEIGGEITINFLRKGVKNVIVPETLEKKPVVRIADGVFKNNTEIESVVFGGGFYNYTPKMLEGCTSIKSLTVSGAYDKALYYLFGDGVSSVPESLSEIRFSENSARFDTTLFKSRQANHTVTHVVDYDKPNFKECRSLKSVVLTDGVNEIGNNAFWSCVSLNRAVIGDGVESIGKWAFYNCETLAEIVIGSSVRRIDEFAFYNCRALKTVFFHGTEKEWNNISVMHGNENLIFAARYYYSEAASGHGDDF